MSLISREFWSVLHGWGLGALLLLAFAAGLAGLYGLRREWETIGGIREQLRRLVAGTWIMAILGWLTVIVGTWVVYPWYRATPPEGADLKEYPRSYLLSDPSLEAWHTFGMEWKEHVTWLSPILATAVAYVVLRYGFRLADAPRVRWALIVLFVVAFLAAGIGGLLGALISRVAPIL